MAITWLADVLREAGVKVVEEGSWKTRKASSEAFNPIGVLWHHTAGAVSSASRPAPSLSTCINGRSDLPGPLCHALVDYNGVFHLISANIANHAGDTRRSGPIPAGWGNGMLVGWEIDYSAQNNQQMSAAQYEASIAATAAVLTKLGKDASFARGHRETSINGKIDPSFIDLDTMRRDVAARMAGGGSSALTQLFETTSATGWKPWAATDTKGVPIKAQQVSATARADGTRLVFYLVNGQVLLLPPRSDPMWVPGQAGVSHLAAMQVGSVTYLYTVRGGKLYEAHSGDGWASRPVYANGAHQVADKVAAIVRADGTRMLYALSGGSVVQLAGVSTGWYPQGVPNHFGGDVRDLSVVRNSDGLVLYALRSGGWITAAGSTSWTPMTVYSGQTAIQASALSVIGNPDNTAILYTVNNGNVYEAGSNANWNNLRVGTLSGQTSVSAISVGGTKFIYSR